MTDRELFDAVQSILAPPAVTVVGASESSVYTGALLANLCRNGYAYGGRINFVNPRRTEVHGVPCVASVAEVEGELGLLFLLVPPAACAEVLSELQSDPSGVVIAAAGFGESGNTADEQFLTRWCAERRVVLLGPNCLGYVSLSGCAAYASPLPEIARGPVALVTQSSGLFSGIVRALSTAGVGVEVALACGNAAGNDPAALARALLLDSRISAIALYLESTGDPAELVELGRAAQACGKPIVMVLSGASTLGEAAARSHTGELATPRAVVLGAAAQGGIITVRDVDELVWSLEALSAVGFARTPSSGVGVFSGTGGGAIMLADAAEGLPLDLPPLDEATQQVLGAPGRVIMNPYDTAGTADSDEDYARQIDAFAADSGLGVVVSLAGTGLPEPNLPFHFRRGQIFADAVARHGKQGVIASPISQSEDVAMRLPGIVYAAGARRVAVKLAALSVWSQAAGRPEPPTADATDIPLPDGVAPGTIITGGRCADLMRELPVVWPRSITVTGGMLADDCELPPVPIIAKTEAGIAHRLVKGGLIADLTSRDEIQVAAEQLYARFGAEVSLTEQLEHGDELVVGCERISGRSLIMFGEGGSSVGENVTFRVLPMMAGEIDQLIASYVSVSERAEVAAFVSAFQEFFLRCSWLNSGEINPFIVNSDRGVIALDAKLYVGAPDGIGERAAIARSDAGLSRPSA